VSLMTDALSNTHGLCVSTVWDSEHYTVGVLVTVFDPVDVLL